MQMVAVTAMWCGWTLNLRDLEQIFVQNVIDREISM